MAVVDVRVPPAFDIYDDAECGARRCELDGAVDPEQVRVTPRDAKDVDAVRTCDLHVVVRDPAAEHEVGTDVAVEIFGEWIDGVVAAEPLYDPVGEKIRA